MHTHQRGFTVSASDADVMCTSGAYSGRVWSSSKRLTLSYVQKNSAADGTLPTAAGARPL